MTKISKFLESFIKQNEIKIKRTNSMLNLRPHSKTIASATTCDDSTCIEEDTNLNISQLIDNKNKINENKNKLGKNMDDFLKNNDIEKNIGEGKEQPKSLIRSKSVYSLREMLPKYKDEEESIDVNIKYIESSHEISFISIDLMLKKIIFENFLNDNIFFLFPKKIFLKN